jgi:anti-sigma regulatory factor (Ser/Thr protein kinase)
VRAREPNGAAPDGPLRARFACKPAGNARIVEPLAETIELGTDPSELRVMRAFVGRWADRSGVSDDERFRACLVATEAVTNSMRHARMDDGVERPIRLSCRVERSELVVEVADRGRFRRERERVDDNGGRGLFLIRECTRSFDLHAGSDGTRLTMHLRAAEPELAVSAA